MEILIVLGLLAAASGLLVFLWRRRWSRDARQATRRDDTLRAGDSAATSPEEAARRAGDRSAWMIPSGF